MTGMRHAEVCEDEAELAQMLAADRNVMESGRPLHISEETMNHPDGSAVLLETHKIPFKTDGASAVLIISADITERKRAGEALRVSEQRYDYATEATQDGIWDLDIQIGKVQWSPHCYTMLEYEANAFEMTYDRWKEMIHPDDRLQIVASVASAIERGEPFSLELRYRKADGTFLWILGRGKTVEWDEQGKPIRMVGTHTDISARKEVEFALEAREERFQRILEVIPDMISVHDSEMNIVFSNWNGFGDVPLREPFFDKRFGVQNQGGSKR